MQTSEIMSRAVLAYVREYPGSRLADIAGACGVPPQEVKRIVTHHRLLMELTGTTPGRGLDWSAPRRVKTRFGQRDLRTANPPDWFWQVWHRASSKPQAIRSG